MSTVPLIIAKILPYFGGDQRITHKIELSARPQFIIKTNKNEMIQTLEEEIIIMKYGWHLHKQDYIDATTFTWILSHIQKESEKNKNRE